MLIRTRLDAFFGVSDAGSSLRTELLAGLATFVAMAYILVVHPGILSQAGMPFEAVFYATALSAAVGSLLMGLLANYPIALAPGMGINAYFTYTVVLGMGLPWTTALGVVFLSGIAFVALTLTGVREAVLRAVPVSLKAAIGAGIGLFIAFIGLKNGGIVVDHPATLVGLGPLGAPAALLTVLGLGVTGMLMARGVGGALLLGMAVTSVGAAALGLLRPPPALMAMPSFSAWTPVLGQLDVGSALELSLLHMVFAFFFVDFFDTVGTLLAVGRQGGLLDREGHLPRAPRALLADALATVAGAVFGTPTVTSYIESGAGVAVGGRTGLTAVVVGGLFLLCLPLAPLVQSIAGVSAITAPALVLVGALMVGAVADVEWRDFTEALPAFLVLVTMPLSFSIATGIAVGFAAWPLLKLASGRAREIHPITWALWALFVARFAWMAE